MGALLVTALGLGVAGLDPAGALIAVAALAAGARKRAVLAYAAVVVAGTAAFGTALSLLLGAELADVDWSFLVPAGDGGALLELAAAAGLLVWAFQRRRRPEGRPPRPKRAAQGAALAGVGALFAASAALDPTFVGMVVIAGRDGSVVPVALAHLIWVVISQAPLVLLAGAVAANRHERPVAAVRRGWARIAPAARTTLTVVLALAGLTLLADAGAQLLTGRFLIAPGA